MLMLLMLQIVDVGLGFVEDTALAITWVGLAHCCRRCSEMGDIIPDDIVIDIDLAGEGISVVDGSFC